jgi:hypothetical protein
MNADYCSIITQNRFSMSIQFVFEIGLICQHDGTSSRRTNG